MLTEFIRYLSAERRYSPLTVRNYKHDVGQFLAWLDFDEARSDPRSITADQVREWIIHRTEEGKIGAASMNREIASIRTLFRWLLRTGAIEKDICRTIPSLKTSRRLPAFIPESRMTAIVSECEEADGDFETARNSLVILMFYACGLRLAELVGIDRDDFSADYASLRVRGKGDKQRIGTDPRIRTRKDFKLPRPNCEAKYLQFCGKSTIFNTQRKAHIAERRLPHGTGGTDPCGRTRQEKPPCAPPYVCDAPAERRSRYARDPGASGTRFVTGHAGLYAQQHRQAPGDIRKGPSPGKGREVINFYKL